MVAVLAVDQLGIDADPIPNLSNASFQNEMNPQLLGNLSDVELSVLVGEGGIACDYEKFAALKMNAASEMCLENCPMPAKPDHVLHQRPGHPAGCAPVPLR